MTEIDDLVKRFPIKDFVQALEHTNMFGVFQGLQKALHVESDASKGDLQQAIRKAESIVDRTTQYLEALRAETQK